MNKWTVLYFDTIVKLVFKKIKKKKGKGIEMPNVCL